MRTVLVAIYLIFYTILSLPFFLIFFLVGLFDKRKKAIYSQIFVNNVGFKPILFVSGVKLTVKGKENVLKNESAMYAFNHRGFFDTLAAYTTAPYPTAFVSKVEIKKVPMLSWWMKYMNNLFLDRKDMKKGLQIINEGIELLKNGTSIYIAPEGTRNTKDELLEFHAASFRLADKSNRPVVPVAINNTENVFEEHFPWIHRAHIIIEYCEPVYMDKLERAERKKVPAQVRETIQKKVLENKKEIEF